MAGIYFHIPFCKQACHYCDFHFSTSLKQKDGMLIALKREIALRSDYLKDKNIQSIYFGGGTPSILEAEDISELIDGVAQHFSIAEEAEITLEANPDDLHEQKVRSLRKSPINRFSIGIQSFFEEDLRWMNRAHNAGEALDSIRRVQDAGFQKITCDLIYGFPLLTDEKWHTNIQRLLQYEVPHISCYSMTIEPRTALAKFIESGKTMPMNEGQSADQFEFLVRTLQAAGYTHYEISNFAMNQQFAVHNTNYWMGAHYLGIGPSAHSFDGQSRSWNIANNALYMRGIDDNTPAFETEFLSANDRINEYIMTALRTMWGIDLNTVAVEYGAEAAEAIGKDAQQFIIKDELMMDEGRLVLTTKGKLLADHIAASLFFLSEEA